MTDRLNILEHAVEKTADRLDSLEQDVAIIRSTYTTNEAMARLTADVAVIKSNYATKEDLALVAANVGIIRSNYATREELATLRSDVEKAINALFWKLAGTTAGLIMAAFFIARATLPYSPQAPAQPVQAPAPVVIPR